MRTHHAIQLRMIVDQRERDLRDARQLRLARRSESRRQRRHVRRSVGRSLVRLGHRLADERAPSLEPVRSR